MEIMIDPLYLNNLQVFCKRNSINTFRKSIFKRKVSLLIGTLVSCTPKPISWLPLFLFSLFHLGYFLGFYNIGSKMVLCNELRVTGYTHKGGLDIKNNAFQIIPQNIQPQTKYKNVILTGVKQENSKKCVENRETLSNVQLILGST